MSKFSEIFNESKTLEKMASDDYADKISSMVFPQDINNFNINHSNQNFLVTNNNTPFLVELPDDKAKLRYLDFDGNSSENYETTLEDISKHRLLLIRPSKDINNNDGISIKITTSDGLDLGNKIIKDQKGKNVKKLYVGKPILVYVSVTGINVSFFLCSGGVDESDETTVGIDGSKVLEGETFIGSDGEVHTGTIPIRTAVNTTLKAGQSVSLESGYYGDKSTITAETLSKQMQDLGVTLSSANQLVKGVKAVDKNGNLITGTATVKSLGGYVIRTFTGTATVEFNTGHSGKKYIVVPAIGFSPKVMYLSGSNGSTSAFNESGGSFDYPITYAGDCHMMSCNALATGSSTIKVGGTDTQAGGLASVGKTVSYKFITWE